MELVTSDHRSSMDLTKSINAPAYQDEPLQSNMKQGAHLDIYKASHPYYRAGYTCIRLGSCCLKIAEGIRSKFSLDSKEAEGYAIWADSDHKGAPTMYLTIYPFNITNPYDVVYSKDNFDTAENHKVKVEQLKPLTYLYHNKKFDVEFKQGNESVEYYPWQYYTPLNEETKQREKQKIYSPNLPFHSVVGQEGAFVFNAFIKDGLNYTQFDLMWIHREIREVIWGYESELLAKLQKAIGKSTVPFTFFPGVQVNETSKQFTAQTRSKDEIFTGKRNPDAMRRYIRWNGMNSLSCCKYGPCGSIQYNDTKDPNPTWLNEEFNIIKGSHAEQFPHFLGKGGAGGFNGYGPLSKKVGPRKQDSTITTNTYGFGLYRAWRLYHRENDIRTDRNILLWNYKEDPKTLKNITIDPEIGYGYRGKPLSGLKNIECSHYQKSMFKCAAFGPSGLVNLTNCYIKAPIFVSKPHFLDASDWVHNAVSNLPKPSRANDDTVVSVEPYTGTTMEIRFNVQINVRMTNYSYGTDNAIFTTYNGDTYTPIIIANRHGKVDHSQAKEFRNKVYRNHFLSHGLRNLGALWAAVMLIMGLVLVSVGADRSSKSTEDDRYYRALIKGYKPPEVS